jgi:hypothetical protein
MRKRAVRQRALSLPNWNVELPERHGDKVGEEEREQAHEQGGYTEQQEETEEQKAHEVVPLFLLP